MKITQLNIDCLESVFKNLELSDLLNMADSNQYLKMVAEMILAPRCKRKFVKLFIGSETPLGLEYRSNFHKDEPRYDRLGYTELECIEIHSLKNCFKVLRCLGHLMFKLSITIHHFRDDGKYKKISDEEKIKEKQHARIASGRIYTYVSKYCTGPLNEIVIDDYVKGNLSYLRRPLLNVEKVHIQGTRLKGIWLNRIFPKMKYLDIDAENLFTFLFRHMGMYSYDYVRANRKAVLFDFTSIENHFANLVHLKICPQIYPGSEIFEANFAQIYLLLRLNPQLQILEIPFIGRRDLLRTISESLPNLQYLTFNHPYWHHTHEDTDDVYCLENVKKFVARFNIWKGYKYPALNFTIAQLEEFHYFNYRIHHGDEPNFYSFLKRHPSIRKFVTIIQDAYHEEAIIEQVLSIVEALPSLNEIGLGCNHFTHNCAIEIIKRCEKLKRYRFWCDPTEPYHNAKGTTICLYEPPHVEWWFYTQ